MEILNKQILNQITVISHFYHFSLWLFPTAPEINHLFVIWSIPGQHSLITHPSKKKNSINWISSPIQLKRSSKLMKLVLISISWCGQQIVLLTLTFDLDFWNHLGWRQFAHLKQASINQGTTQERVFEYPKTDVILWTLLITFCIYL